MPYSRTSKQMRSDPLFMRTGYEGQGPWEIPLIHRQAIDLTDLSLIACCDTRANDSASHRRCGVHFFVDDYRFNCVYRDPAKSLSKFRQYYFLLTPDYSTYGEMDLWRQLESIAHSRWCGAYWQEHGLTVIPTVSWSTPSSYSFCFDGIEKHAIIAIGMIGCKGSKSQFMHGYMTMLARLEPEAIICYGTPFPEMQGPLIVVDYLPPRRKEVR